MKFLSKEVAYRVAVMNKETGNFSHYLDNTTFPGQIEPETMKHAQMIALKFVAENPHKKNSVEIHMCRVDRYALPQDEEGE